MSKEDSWIRLLKTRLRVVSNFGDGDSRAGEIHARVREISRRHDARGALNFRRASSREAIFAQMHVCVFRRNRQNYRLLAV